MDSPPPPVPAEALYGASTQRAVLNFPVSHQPVDPGIIHAYGLIKWAAAHVNGELGHVPVEKTALIQQAAQEVYEQLDELGITKEQLTAALDPASMTNA